ncbi:MAG: hypothetical protein JST88_04350 [Bacteroidetes bacterium]|nr:hypothetical protein [Bacteroidota bacterium]
MASKSKRILYTATATIMGVGVVYALAIVGNQSKGPIESTLNHVEQTIAKVEEKVILNGKSETRADKLSWLKPYFSSKEKVRNPSDFLFGAYDNRSENSFLPNIELEDSLHTQFPLIHVYTAWGSKAEQQFPTKQVNDIITLGSIPVITWEPWLVSFDDQKQERLRPASERDKNGLSDIANGVYDFYLSNWAHQAQKIHAPILLRFGHEMNDPYRYPWGPQNNNPADFVAAWKHVHQVFNQEGATNVVWIWSPHPAFGFFDEYYPGNNYVDYIGIGTLNYGPIAAWAKWWSFDDIFGQHYNALNQFKKPILLTEFASLSYGGNRSKWYAEALKNIPTKYPSVKGLLFFHFNADNTTTQQVLDWSIVNDPKTLAAIRKEVNQWNSDAKKGWVQ